jgi:hypothetical protein
MAVIVVSLSIWRGSGAAVARDCGEHGPPRFLNDSTGKDSFALICRARRMMKPFTFGRGPSRLGRL